MDRGTWWAAVHKVAKSRTLLKQLSPSANHREQQRIQQRTYLRFGSPVAQSVKNPPAIWETQVRSLGWEDPLEKGMAATPVFLLGNPRDRGAWGTTVHGTTQSDMTQWLNNNSPSFQQNCQEAFFLVLSPDPFCSIVSSVDGSPPFLSPHTVFFSEEFPLAKSFLLVK